MRCRTQLHCLALSSDLTVGTLTRPLSGSHPARCASAQIGHAKRLTYKGDLSAVYSVPPPADSLDPKSAAYKAQTDLVVALSANLTEVQKLQACSLSASGSFKHINYV